MALTGRTFRIFVSSTFSDLQEERNALQKRVWPELRKLCRRHGCRFQAIDLRWGVREEAALDQQTMRICLAEIERCRRVSPRPNFLILLGDRYGWRPLPYEIPSDEFSEIERRTASGDDRTLLLEWYERDENAAPAVHVLRARRLPGAAEARTQEAAAWRSTEAKLRAILSQAVAAMPMTEERRMFYEASATEQEIRVGALGAEDAADHVFAFFRRIEGLPQDGRAAAYLDIDEDGRVDAEARRRLDDLRARLRRALPASVSERYVARWTGRGPSVDHIEALCRDVTDRLSRVILEEIRKIEESDPVEREAAGHEAFRAERAAVFCGRESGLRAIADYARSPSGTLLGVFGASGSGKSALLAKAVGRIREGAPDAVVVARFIGATPASTDGRALLAGLCREISRRYGAGEEDVPSEYQDLVKDLPARLALATPERPLVVFIDAVDQLAPGFGARDLRWLPASLPAHAGLIVSAAPGDCAAALERRPGLGRRELLEPMSVEEGREILDRWLSGAGRRLQPEQRDLIMEGFRGYGLPLYLRLAFEEARAWRSSKPPRDLASDVPGLIRGLFARLGSEAHHGRVLVARSLGFLSAAKNGLTEDEIIDLLSADGEVAADFTARSFHRPPGGGLPVVIWSRLYFDLEPYLVERSGDGAALLGFFHRQMAEVAAEEFLPGEPGRVIHQALAGYFARQPLRLDGERASAANLRKLSELPYQLTWAALWGDLARILTDFEFLEAKCTFSGDVLPAGGTGRDRLHSGVYELAEDYRRALEALPPGSDHLAELREWGQFLLAESHVLREFPELLWQQAANQPRAGVVSGAAERAIAEGRWAARPWLQWTNRPASSARSLTVLGHDAEIVRLTVTADGRRLISVDAGGLAKVWEYPSGRFLFDLGGLPCQVGPVAVAGSAVIGGCADGTVRVWSLATGDLTDGWSAPEGPITDMALSPDRKRLAFSHPGRVRIWGLAERREIACIEGGPPFQFSPNGRYLAAHPGMFDLETGRDLSDSFSTGGQTAFSPDSRVFADGGEGPIRFTDIETGHVSLLLVGHTHWIGAVAFSLDGGRLVSTEKHGDIKIWDLDPAASTETWEYFPWNQIGRGEEMRGYQVKILPPRLEIEGHRGTISALAMLPDGRRFLTISMSSSLGPMMVGSDIGIKVWDLGTGTALGSVRGHGDRITAFAMTPDGRQVITGDACGVVRAWDIEKLDIEDGIDTASGDVTSLEISADGRTVAANTTRGKFVIETASGRTVGRSDWTGQWGAGCRDLELCGGRWTAAYVPERRMLEVRESPAGDPVARFVFSEDIGQLDARGSVIAAGGNGTGAVYVFEFKPAGRGQDPAAG